MAICEQGLYGDTGVVLGIGHGGWKQKHCCQTHKI